MRYTTLQNVVWSTRGNILSSFKVSLYSPITDIWTCICNHSHSIVRHVIISLCLNWPVVEAKVWVSNGIVVTKRLKSPASRLFTQPFLRRKSKEASKLSVTVHRASNAENVAIWWHYHGILLGWGLLSQFPPFRYFPNFSALSKHPFVLEYHVYIWQVSPQLSCGDSCQIWMWLKESNSYFCKIENFAYGEINERSFSNPHPWFTCM